MTRAKPSVNKFLGEQHAQSLAARVKESPFFARHAQYLRSLYEGSPGHVQRGPSPADGALAIAEQALREADPQALELARELGARDAQELGNSLLEPLGEEYLAGLDAQIRANALYPEALQTLQALHALPRTTPARDKRAMQARLREVVRTIQETTHGTVFSSMVAHALMQDAKAGRADT